MGQSAYEDQFTYAEHDEPSEIQRLKAEVTLLKNLVGALCNTNFLTTHEDGDEKAREYAVQTVNVFSRRFVEKFKADEELEALEEQKREIEQKIQNVKYGTLKYGKVSDRYATTLSTSMINTASLINQAIEASLTVKEEGK